MKMEQYTTSARYTATPTKGYNDLDPKMSMAAQALDRALSSALGSSNPEVAQTALNFVEKAKANDVTLTQLVSDAGAMGEIIEFMNQQDFQGDSLGQSAKEIINSIPSHMAGTAEEAVPHNNLDHGYADDYVLKQDNMTGKKFAVNRNNPDDYMEWDAYQESLTENVKPDFGDTSTPQIKDIPANETSASNGFA
jgi:hypothetical protein